MILYQYIVLLQVQHIGYGLSRTYEANWIHGLLDSSQVYNIFRSKIEKCELTGTDASRLITVHSLANVRDWHMQEETWLYNMR